jgi:signal transduction histidine kinase
MTVYIFFLTIPVILGLLIIYRAFDHVSVKKIKERTIEAEYDLEDELVTLFSETEKYIDNQALAQFIGELSLKVLKSQKCAVITSRFDIKPYQISYLNGFDTEDIENLLSATHSPFIETIEFNRTILNKFELLPSSALYQLMDRHHLYLGIPMVSKNNLLGLILLGGDRKLFHMSGKDLKFAKFLSIKAGSAFENIQEIQKVVQSQKMADLGTMASQLAHDFQSFISLVKLQTKGNEPLRQHASHMEKIVKDLLNYTRPKDLRLTQVNMNQLIDMSLDLVELPSHITVEKHYSESVPQISVDVDQMRRVFVNLFENSIKSIHQNRGRLKISTRPLRPLSTFRRNTWLYLEILDDGEGIPEEFLEKIFDPFFTTRKKEGGSGMGLAIVKQIITSHQGSIDVTSKLGKGTIFNIRLPYLR